MYIQLKRFFQNDIQTLGELHVFDNDIVIFECKTLELPWKDNKIDISRIPSGIYPASKHTSPKFGKSLWIQKVPYRTEILIHRGNFYTDILGCILTGEDFIDIDGDGNKDVTNSKNTIHKLYDIVLDELAIEILDRF